MTPTTVTTSSCTTEQTGTTARASVSTAGVEGNGYSQMPSISADGRYVVFYSDSSNLVSGDTNGANDVFLHDMQTGTTSRISVSSSGTAGNSESFFPSISADGRYVVFTSAATNLVSGDTNGIEDVFVRDLQAGTTTRVSVSSSGAQCSGKPSEDVEASYQRRRPLRGVRDGCDRPRLGRHQRQQ